MQKLREVKNLYQDAEELLLQRCSSIGDKWALNCAINFSGRKILCISCCRSSLFEAGAALTEATAA